MYDRQQDWVAKAWGDAGIIVNDNAEAIESQTIKCKQSGSDSCRSASSLSANYSSTSLTHGSAIAHRLASYTCGRAHDCLITSTHEEM